MLKLITQTINTVYVNFTYYYYSPFHYAMSPRGWQFIAEKRMMVHAHE